MPTAGYPDGQKEGKQLEKIGSVVTKIAEKITFDEKRNMLNLGATADMDRHSGVKTHMRDHI